MMPAYAKFDALSFRTARSADPESRVARNLRLPWMPAFAGMTTRSTPRLGGMMRRFVAGAVFVSALCSALCACSDLTDTHRWSSARTINGTGEEANVRVYAAPGSAPAATPAAPFGGLSDAAQAAYVTAQAKYAKTAAQLKALLSAPFAKPSDGASGQPITDRVQRILVATITRPIEDYRPGDRIMRAVISIRPLNFTFGNYTVAQTDRKTLDVTALTRSTTQTGSLSVSAPSGAAAGGTASAGITHAVGTTTTLHEAEEILTINPTPGCLTITREGGYGIDLTGNTLISLATMAAEPRHEDACGVRAPTKLIRIQDSGRQRVFVVDPNLTFTGRGPAISAKAVPGAVRIYPEHPFAAQVTMDFVLRRIDRGADSYEEGAHAVSLISGHKTSCQVVLPADELTPLLFGIVNSNGDYVDIMVDGRPTVLAFADPEAARSAAQWMTKTHATHLGSLPLTATRAASYISGPLPPKAGGSICDQQPGTP